MTVVLTDNHPGRAWLPPPGPSARLRNAAAQGGQLCEFEDPKRAYPFVGTASYRSPTQCQVSALLARGDGPVSGRIIDPRTSEMFIHSTQTHLPMNVSWRADR